MRKFFDGEDLVVCLVSFSPVACLVFSPDVLSEDSADEHHEWNGMVVS